MSEVSPASQGGTPGRQRWILLGIGLLTIVIGSYLTVRPFASLAVLLLMVVLGLLFAGVSEIVQARGERLPVARGVAYLVGAVAVVAFTGLGVRAVIVAVGLSLVVGGALDLVEGRASRGVERWNGYLGGAASVVFGVLALAWPDVSVIVIGVLLGVRLVLLGGRLVGRAVLGQGRWHIPGRRWWALAGNGAAVLVAGVLVLVSIVLERGAPEVDDFYTAAGPVPDEPGQLVRAEPFTRSIPAGARAWRILYTTTREDGVPALASGLVVVPDSASTGAGRPVIGWAHGTTGAAQGCAPTLLEPFESGAFFNLDRVLEEGWGFVATDYVGLGTEGPHPYLIGEPEGRSVLDAIRASRQLDEAALGDDVVVWGHSQGGHAALWTGILAPTYAPELPLDGVAALAPASNLPALIDHLGNVTGGELFASYVIDAYAATYDDVSYAEYVRPGAQPIVEQMAERCLEEPSTLLSIATSLSLDKSIWNGDPNRGALAARLQENVPAGRIEAPLLLGQGAADQLVAQSAQDAYVAERCAQGQQVDYRVYDGLDHVPLVEADSPAIPELIEWTKERLAGAAPKNGC